MNGNRILVDTNIAIYLLNGDVDLADILNDKKLFVSFVTQLELLGYDKITLPQEKIIENMLSYCVVVDINNAIKSEVIRLKRNYKIKLPDSIIAATAFYLDLPLMTADKGFSRIEELNLMLYEK
jgi:predicted nucleic acid-binding protein